VLRSSGTEAQRLFASALLPMTIGVASPLCPKPFLCHLHGLINKLHKSLSLSVQKRLVTINNASDFVGLNWATRANASMIVRML